MEIKLLKPADPKSPITKPYWVTLGGGVEENESLEQAAQRELFEETGFTDPVGPIIWRGQWQAKGRLNDEYYFIVNLKSEQALNLTNLEETEKAVVQEMSWWTLESLRNTQEVIIPQSIDQYLEPILRGELPKTPLTIDLSTPTTS